MAAAGEIPVETLQPGDLVFTYLSRRLVPIRWIGHRTVQSRPRFHGFPAASVIVHQNAFGPSLPSRDLVLSPDHSVYIHGKLVPVRYLTNAATIAWREAKEITYYHVELDRHDGNRAAFANGGEPRTSSVSHPRTLTLGASK
jgi:hypothetical protein